MLSLKACNTKAVELGSESDVPATSRDSEKPGAPQVPTPGCLVPLGAARGLFQFPLLTSELLKDKPEAY